MLVEIASALVGRIVQNKLIFLRETLNILRPRRSVSRFCIQGCLERNLGQNGIMAQFNGDCWRWPTNLKSSVCVATSSLADHKW